MWFWGGFSSSVFFLVWPAQECRREREGVGELKRKTQKKLLGFRQRYGDGEFGERGITPACSSAPTKAQGSWSSG